MNSPAPISIEAGQLDWTVTRKERIYWLTKKLDKAKYEQDVAAQLRLEKEIQIQKCYIQIEG